MKRVVPEKETRFSWREKDGAVEATCPGATACAAMRPRRVRRTELGLVYVDFDVPTGTAEGIARFYNEVMQARRRKAGTAARHVAVGRNQS